jgi:hypothetical protein
LEEVLNQPTIDVTSMCERMQRRDIPADWKIIMIHEKERVAQRSLSYVCLDGL